MVGLFFGFGYWLPPSLEIALFSAINHYVALIKASISQKQTFQDFSFCQKYYCFIYYLSHLFRVTLFSKITLLYFLASQKIIL